MLMDLLKKKKKEPKRKVPVFLQEVYVSEKLAFNGMLGYEYKLEVSPTKEGALDGHGPTRVGIYTLTDTIIMTKECQIKEAPETGKPSCID